MLTATTNGLSAETKTDLQRLLTALNAMPAAWANNKMVVATMVGDDVAMPKLDEYGLVLMPFEVWSAAQDTWSDAMVELNADKPFALDATVSDAKKRIVEALNMPAGNTSTSTPIPPTAPTPTLPVDPITKDDDGMKLIDPYADSSKTPDTKTPDTKTPDTKITTTTTSPTTTVPPLKGPSWPYWAAGGVGLAVLVGLLVRRGTGSQVTTVAGLRGRKIVGSFCEEELAPKRNFDSGSFRWKRTGSSWLMVGCPRGEWDQTQQWCRVGTRGYRLLSPTSRRKSCPKGSRRITKG